MKARKKNNRLWSGEFKLKVVLDIIENELSYSQAARNLSVMGETRKLHPHPVFGRLVGAVDQLISDNESYYLTKSITSGFQSRGVHLCTIAPSGVCIITRFWCKQAVFSPFRLSDLTINTRKPLKSKDSSIVSILESFCVPPRLISSLLAFDVISYISDPIIPGPAYLRKFSVNVLYFSVFKKWDCHKACSSLVRLMLWMSCGSQC